MTVTLSPWTGLSEWLLEGAEWLGAILRACFTCNHAGLQAAVGKCYCPTCGKGVILRWTRLRCGHCGIKRQSRYLFRQIIPTEKFCPYCGYSQTETEYLENPAYYQLHQALLTVVDEEIYLQQRLKPAFSQAWIDGRPQHGGVLKTLSSLSA
jgi:uncharacterized protein (DUF983 family)